MRSRWVHLIWSRSKRNLLPSHKQWSSYQKCRMRGKNAFKRIALDGGWTVAKTINMEPSFPRMPTLWRQSRITKLMRCNAMHSEIFQLPPSFQFLVSHQNFLNSSVALECWGPWRVSVCYENISLCKKWPFSRKVTTMSLFCVKVFLNSNKIVQTWCSALRNMIKMMMTVISMIEAPSLGWNCLSVMESVPSPRLELALPSFQLISSPLLVTSLVSLTN